MFSCQYRHVINYSVVFFKCIFINFWNIPDFDRFDPKKGKFWPPFRVISNLKNNPRNGFLDPRNIPVHVSHFITIVWFQKLSITIKFHFFDWLIENGPKNTCSTRDIAVNFFFLILGHVWDIMMMVAFVLQRVYTRASPGSRLTRLITKNTTMATGKKKTKRLFSPEKNSFYF